MAEPPEIYPQAQRVDLDARYGRRPARSRRTLILLAAAGTLVLAAFVALALASTQLPVRTQEAAFQVTGPASVEVTFNVIKDPAVVADCTVVALSESFAEVGVATVRVGPDTAEVVPVTATVRTTEPAHGARVGGCAVVRGR